MSINSVVLTGRLGQDPEIKSTQSGKSVASLSLAVESGFGDKKKTDWFRLVAWEKLADVIGEHLHKGSRIAVTGRLQARDYTDKQEQKRTVTEVVINSLEFLDPKPESSGNRTAKPAPKSRQAEPDDSDEIPF